MNHGPLFIQVILPEGSDPPRQYDSLSGWGLLVAMRNRVKARFPAPQSPCTSIQDCGNFARHILDFPKPIDPA